MKTRRLFTVILTLALAGSAGLAATAPAAKKGDSETSAAVKKVTERYALTKARIANLLGQRLNPDPLPNPLPNPFYHPLDLPATDPGVKAPADTTQVPAAPDITDADTLAKFISTLKISGVVILNDQAHLALNQALCKVGDVIPVGTKEHTAYIQVLAITPDELTLGLNDAKQTVRLKQ